MTRIIEPSRAKRLKQLTREVHEVLDRSIMAAASFETLPGYVRFVEVQYRFHHDIAALYIDPVLSTLLPGLAERSRVALVEADFADLGRPLPQTAPPIFAPGTIDMPTALGWLYVAEGSNMGAALLRKAAAKLGLSDTHGAQHLVPAPEGPAAHWRAFTATLNAVVLSDAEEERAVAGAKAAFARVQRHADLALA